MHKAYDPAKGYFGGLDGDWPDSVLGGRVDVLADG
jgi:hypothetical protein